ncbi:MAG: ABC transporter ATP-binding protein [Planctomycetota bacterium]
MIEVAHLTRRFGGTAAVDDLTFTLEKGEVVGFLGPNGAGKTTTMRILTGYLPATRAEVLRVAGHDVLRESLAVRRRIGYLPESVPLYPELRVGEMLRFQGRLHGLDRAALKARVPAVLDRVGVLDRERQLVGKLSRGLRQRVGLAVALLPNPDVLILDEPTSGLDPLQRREVRALIKDLANEHTVLLSSHILGEVESIAARVIIIHRGRKVADGTQAEIVERLAGSFGGRGHVRFEAFVGDAEAAAELMRTLDGVARVLVGERVGIHHGFQVEGEGDLREDLGALALARGWAVRELSRVEPTLEELFTRLVTGGDEVAQPELAVGAAPAQPAAHARAADPVGGPFLAVDQPALLQAQGAPQGSGPSTSPRVAGPPSAAAAASAEGGRVIYSLNPFDRGAQRDLSQPVRVDAPPAAPVGDVPLPPPPGPAPGPATGPATGSPGAGDAPESAGGQA